MPDMFSFGPFFLMTMLGFADTPFREGGPPPAESIPEFVYSLYNITHSFIIFAVVFAIVWAIFKRPIMEMLAWPLHILVDIPTHSYQFFPTPFLWPVSDIKIDGTPWGEPWIFFPNLALLGLAYGVWYWRRTKKE